MSTSIPDDLRGETDQLVADSSRPSKFDSQTMALATELLISQFSTDMLQKIRHTLEAFLTLEKEQKEKITTEEERRELFIMRRVCLSLMAMYEVPNPPHNYWRKMCIPWNFGTLEAGEYLSFHHILATLKGWNQDFIKKIQNGDLESTETYLNWIAFETQNGTEASWCLMLKTEFEDYAIPIVAELSTKIRKNFIDGSTWEQALFGYRGGKQNADSTSSRD